MKKVVFTFGRMNPPTIGHEKLVNKLKAVASKEKADARLYLSHTNKPGTDPLSYKDKLKFAQKAFGIAYKSNAKQIFQIAKELQNEGYTHVYMVVGSDRVAEFNGLLKKYNGKGDYDFKSIKVISAGQRDPDAKGVAGMSGTKLRNLAKDGDMKTFMSGLASGLSVADKKKVYALVSKNMKEELELDEAKKMTPLAKLQKWDKGRSGGPKIFTDKGGQDFVRMKKSGLMTIQNVPADEVDKWKKKGYKIIKEAFNIEVGAKVKMGKNYGKVIGKEKVMGKPGLEIKWNDGTKGRFPMSSLDSLSMDRKADYKIDEEVELDEIRRGSLITSLSQIKDNEEYMVSVYDKLPSGNYSGVASTFSMMGKEIKTKKKGDFKGRVSIVRMKDFVDSLTMSMEEVELTERKPLTVQQRLAKGRMMRRLAPKMARKRAMKAKRMADPRALKMRAQKAAIKLVRKKVAGKKGINYNNLSPSDKSNVDKLVMKKQALVRVLTKKLLPIVRKAEQKRLADLKKNKNEDFNSIVEEFFQEGPQTDRVKNRIDFEKDRDATRRERDIERAKEADKQNDEREKEREKARLEREKEREKAEKEREKREEYNISEVEEISLRKKSNKVNVPYETIKEVYDRGMKSWDKDNSSELSQQQWAFARVNSFITGGKTLVDDADLLTDINEQFEDVLNELAWYTRVKHKIDQMTHPALFKSMVSKYVDLMKQPKYKGRNSFAASTIARETRTSRTGAIEPRELIGYINKLVKQGVLPKELKAEYYKEAYNPDDDFDVPIKKKKAGK